MTRPIAALGLFLVATAGCQRAESPTSPSGVNVSGRYQGVGVYRAGEMWSQVSRSDAPSDAAAARLDDDDEIIVVIDNVTGEIRQCGNLSGHCIAMNPWSATVVALPAPLRKHADELRQETEAAVAAPAAKQPLNPR